MKTEEEKEKVVGEPGVNEYFYSKLFSVPWCSMELQGNRRLRRHQPNDLSTRFIV
jgi:hypothetical protein